jgi:hypothetical protein
MWTNQGYIFHIMCTAFLLVLLLTQSLTNADTLTGRVVRVTDGDTIVILDPADTQHKIRLTGIDAPERKQAFGTKSKEYLQQTGTEKQALGHPCRGVLLRSVLSLLEFKLQSGVLHAPGIQPVEVIALLYSELIFPGTSFSFAVETVQLRYLVQVTEPVLLHVLE